MKLVAVAVVAVAGCADPLNDAALHAHVDELVQHDRDAAQPIDHVTTSLELLVPVLGSARLDRAAFGSIRPSGVVFDWVLGGIAPLALVGASFAVADGRARRSLRWAALGLYLATRAGVLVIGNLHVSEYDDYLANISVGWRWQR